jgi:hypothetical protein
MKVSEYLEELARLRDDNAKLRRQLDTCDEVIEQMLAVPADSWDGVRALFKAALGAAKGAE